MALLSTVTATLLLAVLAAPSVEAVRAELIPLDLREQLALSELLASGLPLSPSPYAASSLSTGACRVALELPGGQRAELTWDRVLVYAPAIRKRQRRAYSATEARDDRVGWISFYTESPIAAAGESFARYMDALSLEHADLDAWIGHRMWETTAGFRRIHDLGTVATEVNVGPTARPGVLSLAVQVDWVNHTAGREGRP